MDVACSCRLKGACATGGKAAALLICSSLNADFATAAVYNFIASTELDQYVSGESAPGVWGTGRDPLLLDATYK
jgi:hypothetical protein